MPGAQKKNQNIRIGNFISERKPGGRAGLRQFAVPSRS